MHITPPDPCRVKFADKKHLAGLNVYGQAVWGRSAHGNCPVYCSETGLLKQAQHHPCCHFFVPVPAPPLYHCQRQWYFRGLPCHSSRSCCAMVRSSAVIYLSWTMQQSKDWARVLARWMHCGQQVRFFRHCRRTAPRAQPNRARISNAS